MSKKSGKEALLLWVQKCIATIVHFFAPEKFGESWPKVVSQMTPAQRLDRAFDAAEQCGVPKLLDTEDIIDMPKPDQLSIITYVSELYHGMRSYSSGEAALRAPLGSVQTVEAPVSPTKPPGLAGASGHQAASPDGKPAVSTKTAPPTPTTPSTRSATVSASPGRPCAKCHRPLNQNRKERVVEFDQCLFHESCLVCFQCGEQLINNEDDANCEIESVGGRPQCNRCRRAVQLSHRVRAASQRMEDLPQPPPADPLPTPNAKRDQNDVVEHSSTNEKDGGEGVEESDTADSLNAGASNLSVAAHSKAPPVLPAKKDKPALPPKPPKSPVVDNPAITPKKHRVRTYDAESLAELVSPSRDLEEKEEPGLLSSVEEIDNKYIDLQGPLLKKGDAGLLRPWHQRFFVFRDNTLIYYKNEAAFRSGVLQGVIALDDCSACATPCAEVGRFQINTPTRIWLLQAVDDEEAASWIRQIRFRAKQAGENVREVSVATGGGQFQGTRRVKHEPLSGYLNLMVGVNRAWRKRWVVVKDSMILVFSNEKSRKPSKKIPLYHCGLREYNKDDPPPNLGSDLVGTLKRLVKKDESIEDFSNSFQVCSKTMSVVFQSDGDETNFHKWLNTILKHKVAVEEIVDSIEVEWMS